MNLNVMAQHRPVDHKRSWPISCRSIIASKKPIVAPYGNPDLMQAARDGAIGIVSFAYEVLIMEDDSVQVIKVNGEGVQSFRLAAIMKYEGANLRRKAADVLRVITIFRTTEVGAAAR
jgi:hypothetical protein